MFFVILGVVIRIFLLGGSGSVTVSTSWTISEVADGIESYFVPDGWAIQSRGTDFLVLKRGVNGCSALFFLVLFLPLGLVYLFTEWGRAKLTARYSQSRHGSTEVELNWSNAAIQRQIDKVVEGLGRDE